MDWSSPLWEPVLVACTGCRKFRACYPVVVRGHHTDDYELWCKWCVEKWSDVLYVEPILAGRGSGGR